MPNDLRTRVKISGNRSYDVMNRLQILELNIIEAMWVHLDREQNERQPTSKDET